MAKYNVPTTEYEVEVPYTISVDSINTCIIQVGAQSKQEALESVKKMSGNIFRAAIKNQLTIMKNSSKEELAEIGLMFVNQSLQALQDKKEMIEIKTIKIDNVFDEGSFTIESPIEKDNVDEE